MSQDQTQATKPPSVAGWWIAAIVAVAALVGVIVLLTSNRPLPLALGAPPADSVRAEHTLAAAENAADRAARSAQSAAESKASVTEIAASSAADRSAATVQDVAVSHEAALTDAAAAPQ